MQTNLSYGQAETVISELLLGAFSSHTLHYPRIICHHYLCHLQKEGQGDGQKTRLYLHHVVLGNLFRNAGISAGGERTGLLLSFLEALTWTGSPTTALCTASRAKLCFMMGMQFCCTFVATKQRVQEIWSNPSCSTLGNLSLNHCMKIHGQGGRGKMRDSFYFSRPPPLHKLGMIK